MHFVNWLNLLFVAFSVLHFSIKVTANQTDSVHPNSESWDPNSMTCIIDKGNPNDPKNARCDSNYPSIIFNCAYDSGVRVDGQCQNNEVCFVGSGGGNRLRPVFCKMPS
ncbi:hypothetical protein [endosymbiont GvMRE of Glomus versiforme]|uniref:hypothetical protein n=1 Tax=endosymbiont GvMRE of Glomus versiforme TaxID=2039283 RepID=UPI000EBE1DFD|nr:hypothetical protein [endosymbiont GvMRE of Glomus versiforme]RHZ35665.1 hypothetical protein GvMRE_IIg316 [endosymbiont GvMRE of Glomus versiforme]